MEGKAADIGRSKGARVRKTIALLSCAIALAGLPWRVRAIEAKTGLVAISAGNGWSASIRDLESGSYELSNGTPVRFAPWYSSHWRNLRMTWLTALSDDFGVYWGFSTGESGKKYVIEPGLKVGVLLRRQLSSQSAITFSVTTILGGRLKERACIADYGAIGGVQRVNCRLAAGTLPPSETLKHLLNEPPQGQIQISARFVLLF